MLRLIWRRAELVSAFIIDITLTKTNAKYIVSTIISGYPYDLLYVDSGHLPGLDSASIFKLHLSDRFFFFVSEFFVDL